MVTFAVTLNNQTKTITMSKIEAEEFYVQWERIQPLLRALDVRIEVVEIDRT
ncbi:hypothetical protein [Roseomonas chloroacetimidivorans]|uniref:hypothetical protein n=1 Tax=Roseomonas chloroacetimidivorans TaxID=1766656 RepID=UPI003C78EA01